MEELFLDFFVQNPKLAIPLFIIGVLRVIFKPLQGVIEEYVKGTESQEDDKKLAEIKQKAWFKAVVWAVDYTASLKLPGWK